MLPPAQVDGAVQPRVWQVTAKAVHGKGANHHLQVLGIPGQQRKGLVRVGVRKHSPGSSSLVLMAKRKQSAGAVGEEGGEDSQSGSETATSSGEEGAGGVGSRVAMEPLRLQPKSSVGIKNPAAVLALVGLPVPPAGQSVSLPMQLQVGSFGASVCRGCCPAWGLGGAG